MPQKIYEEKHQGLTINGWKHRGLICREGETYKGIYSFYISSQNCNLCSIKFNDEIHNEKKTMDHSHETGYFRQVLCMKCNKGFDRKIRKDKGLSHRWIGMKSDKRYSSVTFRYRRTGFKGKTSTSLTKMIAYSFIQLLKVPI